MEHNWTYLIRILTSLSRQARARSVTHHAGRSDWMKGHCMGSDERSTAPNSKSLDAPDYWHLGAKLGPLTSQIYTTPKAAHCWVVTSTGWRCMCSRRHAHIYIELYCIADTVVTTIHATWSKLSAERIVCHRCHTDSVNNYLRQPEAPQKLFGQSKILKGKSVILMELMRHVFICGCSVYGVEKTC